MNPVELLSQAHELAQREPGRLTDADLRRAVSACYYALFHAISDDAAALVASSHASQLRSAVRRTITHQQVRRACDAVSAPPKPIVNSWRNFLSHPVEAYLVTVGFEFAELQEARYLADYDSFAVFGQKEVLELHFRAMVAHDHWLNVRHTSNAAVFLTAVLLGDKLGRRG